VRSKEKKEKRCFYASVNEVREKKSRSMNLNKAMITKGSLDTCLTPSLSFPYAVLLAASTTSRLHTTEGKGRGKEKKN
jgi:hypothetical protein